MFFKCELKKLRQLKSMLLARIRCEHVLSVLPEQLAYKIDNCDEAAALKAAEVNLENAKKTAAEYKKKKIRTTTIVAAIISLIATAAVAILFFQASPLHTAIAIVVGTAVLTLIIHLIAKAIIKKGRAKNENEIAACEAELALAAEAFEAAKVRIEAEIQRQIAYYENLLNNPYNGIKVMIKRATVVHDDDKEYNAVCQIIWCFEHKYARSVKEAKQWIELAKHSRYVRQRLDKLNLSPCDEQHIETNANEGKDFSAEIPEAED